MRTLLLELRGVRTQDLNRQERRGRRDLRAAILGALVAIALLRPGTQPAIAVEPRVVSFGNTAVGSPSETQAVMVRNSGTAALRLGPPSIQGDQDFLYHTSCGQGVLDPGQSCEFDVVMRPTVHGQRVALLELPSNASEQPAQVTLSGAGTAVEGAILEPDPPFLDFDQPSGESAAMTLTLRSTGAEAARVQSIATEDSSPFTADRSCEGQSLEPGQSCAVTVTFGSDSAASTIGWLVVKHDGSDQELRIPLRGVTFVKAPPSPPPPPGELAVNPRMLPFKGTTERLPGPLPVEIVNAGQGPLHVLAADVVSRQTWFRVLGECAGAVLGPGSRCRLSVAFVGDRPGDYRDSLVVRTDDRTESVDLIASVAEVLRPQVSVFPPAMTLDSGPEKKPRGPDANLVTVTNVGQAPLRVERYDTTDPRFVVRAGGTPMPCQEGLVLGSRESCQVRVYFKSGAVGAVTGLLHFYDDAEGSPQKVSLQGLHSTPELGNLQVGPFDGNFGPVVVAGLRTAGKMAAFRPVASARPPRREVALTNAGPGALTISSVQLSGDPSFRLDAGQCEGRTLVRGDGCSVGVSFAPNSTRSAAATVIVNHNGGNAPGRLDFQGAGMNPISRRPSDVYTRPVKVSDEPPAIQ